MTDDLQKTGVFQFQYKSAAAAGVFPPELQRRLASRMEPRFLMLFFGLLIGIGTTVFILSHFKPSDESMSQKQILQLQERYASLVLNQDLPQPEEKEPVKTAEAGKESQQGAADEAEEAAEADKKESAADRQVRRQTTATQRQQKREAMKKQIDNIAIFAELTSVGGGGGSAGGSRSVRDLIGSVDASQSLSSIGNVASYGSSGFVSRKESGGEGLRERRGEKAEGGTIGASEMTSAAGATFKSAGNVEVSNAENVEGDAVNDASRSMTALNSVLRRYQPRLVKVYEDYLKRSPDLAGKIVVKFTIEADGSVSNVQLVSSDLNNPSLESDIIRRIERIKFPPASGKLTIEWPVIFTAS